MCLSSLPDPSYLGPALSCTLLCQDRPCGGQDYYSVYSVDHGQGLLGLPGPYPGRELPSTHHTGSHSSLLEQLASINTVALGSAGLLALTLTFLMIVLLLLYFHTQVR